MKNINSRIFWTHSILSLITLGYIGVAYVTKGYPEAVPFRLFAITLPILYGIFGLINYYVIKTFGRHYSFIVGSIFGLLLSSAGRFVLNLPQLLFGFTGKTEYRVHLIAVILYGSIFQFIMTPLTRYITKK